MALKAWQNYDAIFTALSSGDDVLLRDVSDLVDNATHGSIKRVTLDRLLAFSALTPGGRLTLETGVPVSTTNQLAKSVLYYTPYVHDWVRLYTSSGLKIYNFTERSLTLTGLTSGKNYDIFLYDNVGTLTLEPSAAWTNDTTRADALAWQAGVGWVKSGSPTRLWLGTIRTTGTTTTEQSFDTTDAPARQFVWNHYNKVKSRFIVKDSTNSWTYTTATIRQRRASVNNQVEFVCGTSELWFAMDSALSLNNSLVNRQNYVGFDSTTAITGLSGFMIAPLGQACQGLAIAGGRCAPGYHYIASLERSDATDTTTWYGDVGVSHYQFGLAVDMAH